MEDCRTLRETTGDTMLIRELYDQNPLFPWWDRGYTALVGRIERIGTRSRLRFITGAGITFSWSTVGIMAAIALAVLLLDLSYKWEYMLVLGFISSAILFGIWLNVLIPLKLMRQRAAEYAHRAGFTEVG